MKTVSSLLDAEWYERYKRISRLNIRSSIYDVTNRCNLRCKGCFFFSSDEHKAAPEETDIRKWEAFVDREKARGVNLAILIGGEPTLYLDRVEAFYKRLPTYCATNGLIKVPRDRFPDMMVGISLWGDEEDEKASAGQGHLLRLQPELRGRSVHLLSLHDHPPADRADRNDHPQDPDVGPQGPHAAALQRRGGGRLFLDAGAARRDPRRDGRDARRATRRPSSPPSTTTRSSPPGPMLGRPFGWNECPSVTRTPGQAQSPAEAADPSSSAGRPTCKTMHRCCTSETRDCSHLQGRRGPHELGDGQQAGPHAHRPEDLQNWIEVYEMFAKLYRFIPW